MDRSEISNIYGALFIQYGVKVQNERWCTIQDSIFRKIFRNRNAAATSVFGGNSYNWSVGNQGSASGTGSPGFRSPGPENLGPGLILKPRTQIQNLRDLGLGPGLKFEKSGAQDLDRDTSKNGTEILSNPGCVPNSIILSFLLTGTQNQKIRDSGPGLEIEKSGVGDWDRDSDLRDEEFRDSMLGTIQLLP